jgi:hypothetical protein
MWNDVFLPSIKPSQRTYHEPFAQLELDLMIRAGLTVLQDHVRFNMTDSKPSEPILTRMVYTGPQNAIPAQSPLRIHIDNRYSTSKQSGKPNEYAFSMKQLKCDLQNPKTIDRAYYTLQPRRHIWIGDTGASCHFTNDDCGMFNWKPINDKIGVVDGNVAVATKEGNIRLRVMQRNGKVCIVTLHNCKYIPTLPNNLFSITTAIARGWKLTNKGVHICLSNSMKPSSSTPLTPLPMVFL